MIPSTEQGMTAQAALSKGRGGNKESEESRPAGVDMVYVRPDIPTRGCSLGGPEDPAFTKAIRNVLERRHSIADRHRQG